MDCLLILLSEVFHAPPLLNPFCHGLPRLRHALTTPLPCSRAREARLSSGRFSESNFGLGISEIFEFRSIGNRGISSRNLGVSVRHLCCILSAILVNPPQKIFPVQKVLAWGFFHIKKHEPLALDKSQC